VAYNGILQGLAGFDVKILTSGELKGADRKVKRVVDERRFE